MTSAHDTGKSGESGGTQEPDASAGVDTRPLPNPPGAASHFAGRSPAWWTIAALLVFVLAEAFLFRGLLGRDLRDAVAANVEEGADDVPSEGNWETLAETDMRFVVWMVSRGAHALLHDPANYFEAEQCHPAQTALAYGESGLALAIVAAPFLLLTGDPIASFNGMLLLSTLISCFAMYLLVRDWTACPPAGIVAGVIYAFHIMKIGDMTHFMIWDTTWTVFAIFFATRLFARGRWRDAVGLALSISMQTLGSAYPLLAAALLAGPISVWLLVHFGFRQVRIAQLALVAATVGVTALLALSPYLAKSSAGQYEQAAYLAFGSIAYFVPDGAGFPGWIVLALVVSALVLGRRRSMLGLSGDPRWAVLAGGALVFSTCVVYAGSDGQRIYPIIPGQSSGEGLYNLYLLLAEWIPGMEVGRGSGALYCGVHLAISLLAGIGAAALLRAVPARHVAVASGVVIALAWLDVLRPPMLGLSPAFEFRILELRPESDALELFETLASEGETGPLMEYPVKHVNFVTTSKGVLLTAYHHLRSSYCYNSVLPQVSRDVEAHSARLPDAEALAELRALGFETLVVHHESSALGGDRRRQQIATLATHTPGGAAAGLSRIAGNESLTAYRILP